MIRKSIRLPDGKRVEKRFKTKSEADAWHRKMLEAKSKMENGIISIKGHSRKLGEYAEEWNAKRSQHYPAGTWKTERDRLRRYVLPKLALRPLGTISSPELVRFFEETKSEFKISDETVRRIKALLSKMFNDAMAQGLVDYNPVLAIRLGSQRVAKASDKMKFWSTQEEMEAFLDASLSFEPVLYTFSMIALNTGMRLGEILGLKWKDVDFADSTIRVERVVANRSHVLEERTKAGVGVWRTVPLSDSLKTMLKHQKHMTLFKAPEDFIVARIGTHHLSPHVMIKLVTRATKKARVKHIGCHGMRHTFATHFVMQGGSMEDLKEILGHSSIRVTEKYAHFTKSRLERIKNVFQISGGKMAAKSAVAVPFGGRG